MVHSVSQTLTNEDITNLINSGLDRTFITMSITFIILLIRGVRGLVVPLVLAITAHFGILGIFSQLVTPASPYATQLVVLIGLAGLGRLLAVHDQQLRADRSSSRSRSPGAPGSCVFFSGCRRS